jgi:hypothetical protein
VAEADSEAASAPDSVGLGAAPAPFPEAETAPSSAASPVAAGPPPVAVRVGAAYASILLADAHGKQRGELTLSGGRVGGSGSKSLVGTGEALVGARVSESLKVSETSSASVAVGRVARGTVVNVGKVVVGACLISCSQ